MYLGLRLANDARSDEGADFPDSLQTGVQEIRFSLLLRERVRKA